MLRRGKKYHLQRHGVLGGPAQGIEAVVTRDVVLAENDLTTCIVHTYTAKRSATRSKAGE